MRLLITAVVMGPMMLVNALPAAGQTRMQAPAISVQLAANVDSAADRDTYIQKAREKTAEWQKKLDDLDAKANANGNEAAAAAKDDLHKARIKVEMAARRLETVGAEDWEKAKASFERASHKLETAWHKRTPKEK